MSDYPADARCAREWWGACRPCVLSRGHEGPHSDDCCAQWIDDITQPGHSEDERAAYERALEGK